ncbi:hypothetical protein BLL42_24570 [Pseudomonas frederiksbergensis]|uniref:Uncharacterized protein n=2 Tax=Pseudomonas frederiksbergensis TaxID=104087 RepID=A0A1J0ERV0_9PSED|nr:hypothetical protein BLL42_24570 [Pseudomonas frederiksbergensis]
MMNKGADYLTQTIKFQSAQTTQVAIFSTIGTIPTSVLILALRSVVAQQMNGSCQYRAEVNQKSATLEVEG